MEGVDAVMDRIVMKLAGTVKAEQRAWAPGACSGRIVSAQRNFVEFTKGDLAHAQA